jgi:hypothetical protein
MRVGSRLSEMSAGQDVCSHGSLHTSGLKTLLQKRLG